MNTIETAEKLKTIIYGNGRVSWSTAEKIATDISNQRQQSQQPEKDIEDLILKHFHGFTKEQWNTEL